MLKHTAGPWKLCEDDNQWSIYEQGDSGYCIASIPKDDEYGYPEEDEGNAHLITTAPELFESLDEAYALILVLDKKGVVPVETLARMRAVLDKAEGAVGGGHE